MHCACSCETDLCTAMQTGFHAEPPAGSAQLLCMLLTAKAEQAVQWMARQSCVPAASSVCCGSAAAVVLNLQIHAILGASIPHKCIAAAEIFSAGTEVPGQGTCHRGTHLCTSPIILQTKAGALSGVQKLMVRWLLRHGPALTS